MGASQAKSEIKTNQLKYEWIIEKFSSLTTYINSEMLNLPTEKAKCYVQLFPNGNTPERRGYVSVFVCLKEQKFDMTLKVRFDLLSSIDSKTYSQNFTHEYLAKNLHGYGYPTLISRDYIFNEAYGFLIGDKLTLHCHISIIFEELLKGKDSLLIRQQQLFKSGEFNDCAFVCPDGEVPANKFLLASQSTVFRAMFMGNTEEAKTGRVKIIDSNKDVMAAFCEYTSCGTIENLDEIVERLLPLADKYLMDDLKNICARQLCVTLTKENVCGRLVIADLHKVFSLKKLAINFLKDNSFQLNELSGNEELSDTFQKEIIDAIETLKQQQ